MHSRRHSADHPVFGQRWECGGVGSESIVITFARNRGINRQYDGGGARKSRLDRTKNQIKIYRLSRLRRVYYLFFYTHSGRGARVTYPPHAPIGAKILIIPFLLLTRSLDSKRAPAQCGPLVFGYRCRSELTPLPPSLPPPPSQSARTTRVQHQSVAVAVAVTTYAPAERKWNVTLTRRQSQDSRTPPLTHVRPQTLHRKRVAAYIGSKHARCCHRDTCSTAKMNINIMIVLHRYLSTTQSCSRKIGYCTRKVSTFSRNRVSRVLSIIVRIKGILLYCRDVG